MSFFGVVGWEAGGGEVGVDEGADGGVAGVVGG